MTEIIVAAVCALLALIAFVISIRSFFEKGYLFNNAYIWASEEQRKTLDKKPYYRQTAVVFAFICALFLCFALEVIIKADWLWIISGVMTALLLIYAVVSSVKTEKK